jgi:hypothetical protein
VFDTFVQPFGGVAHWGHWKPKEGHGDTGGLTSPSRGLSTDFRSLIIVVRIPS